MPAMGMISWSVSALIGCSGPPRQAGVRLVRAPPQRGTPARSLGSGIRGSAWPLAKRALLAGGVYQGPFERVNLGRTTRLCSPRLRQPAGLAAVVGELRLGTRHQVDHPQ